MSMRSLGTARTGDAALRGRVALLPTGACEVHGPHLPLDTDVRIAVAVAERAAERLDGWVLPAIPYGVAQFGRNFEGTLSVTPGTMRALVAEVLVAAQQRGATKLAIVNAHFEPANVDALFAACAEVEARVGLRPVFPNFASKRMSGRLRAAPFDGHSGIYETSLMLAIAPELVRGQQALAPVVPSLAEGIAGGASSFEEAGGPAAYFGDPARATAEIGRALIEELAEMVVEAVRSV
jgi:creatinine amidohydrolase